MSKSLIAFVTIAAVTCVGLDYTQEARRSGLRVGELTASAYFDTVRLRVAGQSDAAGAGADAPTIVTAGTADGPTTVAGWQRRDLSIADQTLLGEGAKDMLAALVAMDGKGDVQVYQKADAAVAVRVTTGQAQLQFSDETPFAVVQGIPFRQLKGSPLQGPSRLIGARLKDGVTVTAMVHGSGKDVEELLMAITFQQGATPGLHGIVKVAETKGRIVSPMGAGSGGQIARQKVGERKLVGCQTTGAAKFCAVEKKK